MRAELSTSRTSLFRAGAAAGVSFASCWTVYFMSSCRSVRYNNRSIHIQRNSSPIAARELFGLLMSVFFFRMT